MTNHSLFNLQSIETDLQSAIRSSMFNFKDSVGSVNFWAETDLRDNIEQSIRGYNHKLTGNQDGCCGYGDTPGSGFKVTFGLQVLVDYKVRYKANLNLGYGQRLGDFGATTSFHISAYNGGLGTGVGNSNLVVDITAAANVIIGGGQGIPLQSYSLNYNSPIPMLNDFQNSFSYGQLATWNSALNENQFSIDRIQREGMIGFRLGNVNVSSSNDTQRLYFGGGTDMGHTGQLSIATPLFELGFQDFTGGFSRSDDEKRNLILNQIKETKKNDTLSKFQRETRVSELEADLRTLTTSYHHQTPYQKSLNKASTYIRLKNNGYNATIDLIGDAWLQNAIHKSIKDFKFEYNHKKIETWGGKNW